MRFLVTVMDRGITLLPAKLRKILALKAGDQMIAETTSGGVLLRPCVTLPIEIYTDERIREFDAAEAELGSVLVEAGMAFDEK